MELIDCLREQFALHPGMEPQDGIKLCYQAAFGAEHLLRDIGAARAYFDGEFSSVSGEDGPIWEPISPGFCRVNLAPWKNNGLPPEWLFVLFRLTAEGAGTTGQSLFEICLETVEALAVRGEAPFSAAAWREYAAAYRQDGVRPVHHSSRYRERERPAYRVVSTRYASLLPILGQMAGRIRSSGAVTVALDGRSASGKSTVAALLAEITGAGVVHMDDFFLPGKLRTPERLSQPGGNVHYERVLEEVIPHVSSGEAFSYRVFHCEIMELGQRRQVAASPWRIVEGAYSLHPALGDYAGLKVFCHVEPEEQLRRISLRNGEESAAAFRDRWIPMEEKYFDACGIREQADIMYEASAEPCINT